MIQITRSLARTCSKLFRKLARRVPAVVTFEAGGDGLRVRLHRTDIQAEFHQPGQYEPAVIALPLTALADFEGKDGVVTLEPGKDGTTTASWQDAGLPRFVEYDTEDVGKLPAFPSLPGEMAANEAALLKALADACRCAANNSIRYALEHLQLRGQQGVIVATDGGQVLLQSGFHFGWAGDVLVHRCSIFDCPELVGDEVKIGKTDSHVVLVAGGWKIFLPINKEGRFPLVEAVMPTLNKAIAHCHINPEDAAFLQKALPRLPGENDDFSPVTLDLNGHVAVRAKASGQDRVTELVLSKSSADGQPIRFGVNRGFLAQAAQLGFQDLHVVNADTPVLCKDASRKYVFATLGKKGVVPPSENVVRVVSGQDGATAPSTPQPRRKPMNRTSTTNGNGHASGDAQTNGKASQEKVVEPTESSKGLGGLIEEAMSLRDALHASYHRATRLVSALKRHRRQSRLLASTVTALKQLQTIED